MKTNVLVSGKRMRPKILLTALAVVILNFPAHSINSTITVDCSKNIRKINYGLVGAAMGGNAHSFNKDGVRNSISGLLNTVRLECVSGDDFGIYPPPQGLYKRIPSIGQPFYGPCYFDALFAEIDRIQSTGATIIANIFYTPKWLSTNPDATDYYLYPPKDYDLWCKYITAIVYNVNIENNGKRRIDYWEIWNEPSGNYFFKTFNNGEFWNFYSKTSKAIKAGDPTAKVGGYADNPYFQDYKYWAQFQKDSMTAPDFLTVHWYGEWSQAYPTPNDDGFKYPKKYADYAAAIEANVESTLGIKLPLFYTEWNLNAEGNNYVPFKAPSYIANALYWMQCGNGSKYTVDKACFFRIEPYKSAEPLLDDCYNWKPPARILQMFKSLQQNQVDATVPPDNSVILASTNSTKDRVAILISRHDPDGAAAENIENITINNHAINGKYTIKVYLEDQTTNGNSGRPVPMLVSSSYTTAGSSIPVSVNLKQFATALIDISSDIYSAPDENLIDFPGFEGNNRGGWDNGNVMVVNNNPHSGAYALQIPAPYWSFNVINGLEPNTRYNYSVWVKSPDGQPTYIGVKEYGGSEQLVQTISRDYRQVSIDFTTGPTNTSAKIDIGKNAGTSQSYGDDFKLRHIGAGENFIGNPGFEGGSRGNWDNGNVVVTNSNAHTGTYAFQVPVYNWSFNQIQGLKPNTTYAYSCWVKSPDGQQSYIGVKNYGGSEQLTSISSNQYALATLYFTTGAINTTVTIDVGKNAGTSPSYFDDLRIWQIRADQNIVSFNGNCNFENGIGNWGVGNIDSSNLNAHGGKCALQLPPGGWSFNTITGLSQNTDYLFSAWIKNSSAPNQTYIGIRDYGNAEQIACVSGSAYKKVSIHFKTGNCFTSATILAGQNSETESSWLDDFAINQMSAADNYLTDPSLETGVQNSWTWGSVVNSNDHMGTGVYSLLISPNTWMFNTITQLSPNTTYSYNGWIRSPDGSSTYFGIKDYGGSEQSVPVTSSTYQFVSIPFVTGPQNTTATIYVGKQSGSVASYGDDFEIRQ